MKYKFLKEINNAVYYDGDYMEVYIPKNYFDLKIAENNGDKISTMGIFNFIDYIGDKALAKSGTIHTLKLPMMIMFEYESSFEIKKKLKPELDEEEYIVFCLHNGNMFIDSLSKEISAETSKRFIYLIHSGKLPNIIPYEDILKMYLESITLNKVSLGNPSVIFELIISELCRSRKDVNIPFRKEISKDNSKVDQYDYRNINLTRLPSINSTFTSITFEDMNQSLISSIKKNRNNEKEIDSPIEKTIKY